MRRLLAFAAARPLAAGTTRGDRVAGAPPRRHSRARSPRPRVIIALVIAVVAAGGGWLWLRDSSLVDVRQVQVVGLTGPQAGQIAGALRSAARDMTTLHVDSAALRHAAGPFPIVKDVRVSAHPPHRLKVEVVEQVPVAAVALPSGLVGVASDDSLLRGTAPPPGLPLLRVAAPPSGDRVSAPAARRQIAVLVVAPVGLRSRIQEVTLTRAHGLEAVLRRGPALYFGTTARLAAKWQAVAAVLADSSSAGARYVDVRVPERPAAGGVAVPAPKPPDGGPATVPGTSGAATTAPGARTPTIPGSSASSSPTSSGSSAAPGSTTRP